jgi:DnaJ family protein C protein 19
MMTTTRLGNIPELEHYTTATHSARMIKSRAIMARGMRVQTRRQDSLSSLAGRTYGNKKPLATVDFHSYALGSRIDDDQKKRQYHTTAPSEKAVALILGLASVSAVAYAGSSAVQSYNEWQAAQPSPEEVEAQRKEDEKERMKQETKPKEDEKKEEEKNEAKRPRENIFKEWFGVGVGSKYYEGGFEDSMTKKEAALILGVRESSSPKRVKDAYRQLLVLNHPDRGGSTFMAGKINEAKELLLKGKSRM